MNKPGDNETTFTGHGSEWKPSNLTPAEAQRATSWVEAKIDRRSMLTNKDRVEDIRDAMWQLEKDGEIIVHRVDEEQHKPVVARTLYGWEKKIPTTNLWQHKSAAQVLRPVRQHPRLSVVSVLADERARRALSRRD